MNTKSSESPDIMHWGSDLFSYEAWETLMSKTGGDGGDKPELPELWKVDYPDDITDKNILNVWP